MEILNWSIDAILLGIHVFLSFAPPLVGLTVLAAAVGTATLWVFGRTSNQKQLKQVKRRVHAGLLELRIFVDEPAVSLRAQRRLIVANLHYLVLALRSAIWVAVPVGLLLIHLESFYERAPLPIARTAVVTMRMSSDWAPSAPPPELVAPSNVAVLGPPVRVAADREVSWRIRPSSPGSQKLIFRWNGQQVSKWVEAGDRPGYVTGRRVRSAWATILSPGESHMGAAFADWIEIRYPAADLRVFGFPVNWLVWFVAVSTVAALLLRKRFGVVL